MHHHPGNGHGCKGLMTQMKEDGQMCDRCVAFQTALTQLEADAAPLVLQ